MNTQLVSHSLFPRERTGGKHCDLLTIQASIHCCAVLLIQICCVLNVDFVLLLLRDYVCLCVAEYEDASLSSWVNKERFQGYLQIDGFTLYELGETGGVCIKFVIQNMFFTPMTCSK